ncbi:MAG: TetR/AcrR family transcriptional regulator [Anaerolineae bacterium]|nr:TetR/AcrR family transcriptional regulator [Anaerolineae bacterium]
MTKSVNKSPKEDTEAGASPAPRALRETAINEARRALILDAARAVFFELGLEGASLREIAKRAGYTPGAIYTYFNNREEIYAALLSESLERLKEAVDSADSDPAEPTAPALLRARAMAFFRFYQDNPQDLDLGFYLFNGAQPRGLTPELNQQLNDQLRAALLPIQEMLVSLGLAEADAVAETTAIFAHAVGLLMLHHTQRIRLFKQNAQELFEQYLAFLMQRVSR